jgi:hypothetical protein
MDVKLELCTLALCSLPHHARKKMQIFHTLICFSFNLQSKKMVRDVHMYTSLQDCFFAFYVSGHDNTGATGVRLMLVRIGPSCPHANSRLILSLPFAGWTVYRHLHFLAMGTVWRGYPSSGAWLGIFGSTHVHTHCYKVNYPIQSIIGGTQKYIFNHIDHITSRDRGLACSQPLLSETTTKGKAALESCLGRPNMNYSFECGPFQKRHILSRCKEQVRSLCSGAAKTINLRSHNTRAPYQF